MTPADSVDSPALVWIKQSVIRFSFTWICCVRGSCRGCGAAPSLGLVLWSCGRDLCLGLSPALVPALVPSPGRGPGAPSPAHVLFPGPFVPAQTPAAPSPACPSLLLVSAEQNAYRFMRCLTRIHSRLVFYRAQIKLFPESETCPALINAKLGS